MLCCWWLFKRWAVFILRWFWRMDSLTVHAVFAFDYIVLHSPQHLSRCAYLDSFPPLCEALDSLIHFLLTFASLLVLEPFFLFGYFSFCNGRFLSVPSSGFSKWFPSVLSFGFSKWFTSVPSFGFLKWLSSLPYTFVMGCSYQNNSVLYLGWRYHCNLPGHLFFHFVKGARGCQKSWSCWEPFVVHSIL